MGGIRFHGEGSPVNGGEIEVTKTENIGVCLLVFHTMRLYHHSSVFLMEF